MNILIPHTWLLEHLDTDASPGDIQRLVSLSGPSIERIYDREGEPVYDIEVTTNRVDAMSVRGIARECAVILQHAGVQAKLKDSGLKEITPQAETLPIPQVINDPQFCKRVLYVILKDVQHTATPNWMSKRLTQVEIGVHDAVIDITNYITHELGHPCHAFDYDKIMKLGGKIIIKQAEKGEPFTTLDGMSYETVGGEIVFENESGEIIDFPAIKGTANTAIDNNTKNVLFWIESLDPKKVRFGSMKHAIRTVAAQLNEKDVDPDLGMSVLQKGVELYQELCSAQVASPVFDEYLQKRQLSSITLQKSMIDTYLGIELEDSVVKSILEELGCSVDITNQTSNQESTTNSQTITITPPTFRPDLKIAADIVEEVARIYGYQNLPSTLMATEIPLSKQPGVNFKLEEKMKHFLSDIGWQEVYTYSMVSEKLAKESGMPVVEHLKLQNPLTDDKVYLRVSLIPSLNEVIETNPTEKELSVFEFANIYSKQQTGLPKESLMLGMVSNRSLREVKGDFESLLAKLNCNRVQYPEVVSSNPDVSQAATIIASQDGEDVALGALFILSNGRVALHLSVEQVIKISHNHPHYQAIPQTAQIIEDLTFTLPEKSQLGDILSTISAQSELIRSVELKDLYKQNATLTIIYLDPSRNLSSSDIEPLRKTIVEMMKNTYNASLVGKLYGSK